MLLGFQLKAVSGNELKYKQNPGDKTQEYHKHLHPKKAHIP